MFLSSLFSRSSDPLCVNHGTASFGKAAVRAELDYLPDVDASQIELDMTGGFIMIEGFASSNADLARIVETARSVAGRDRVICRAIVCAIAA